MTYKKKEQYRQKEEAVRLEKDLVKKTLKAGDRQSAQRKLFQMLGQISPDLGYPEPDTLFVSTALELSNLCFMLGQNFGELLIYMQTAQTSAKRLGDRRSQALINLHLGRIHYFAERRNEAMKAFAKGRDLVEELGDEDILIQAGEFLGLFFHMQGLFKDAKVHFERAVASYEAEGGTRLINPLAAMWVCYCEAYLGHFHKAIGRLDYYRYIAMESSDQNLATTLRAALGLILLMTKKVHEASFHLSGALDEATNGKNALACYLAQGGLAMLTLHIGKPEKARDMFAEALTLAAESGLIRQYSSPLVLEMLFEFHRLKLESIPQFSFHRELIRVMNEPNIHLKGVALRLKAMEAIGRNKDYTSADSDLSTSEDYLIRCGDPIQLGKTRLEMARMRLKQNHKEKARVLAQKGWQDFSGYGDNFFPDDLRHLLAGQNYFFLNITRHNEFLSRFMEVIEELLPTGDLDRLLAKSLNATNKFFGAERGGLFWFRRDKKAKMPILRAACNMPDHEVLSKKFQPNLEYIIRAYRENQPIVVRLKPEELNQIRALICLPFELNGRTRGVLYHDNSYMNDCFDDFDTNQLKRMGNYLSRYIDRVWRYSRRMEKTALSTSGNLVHKESPEGNGIVTQSPVMTMTLGQADRIAASDGTVLILGETGVGKELLAQRIHRKSTRHERPLVVVDMTTISENLVESELFGHERGAFTGADRQKKGRLELAHRGTLFIDEVGEIPKTIQVKLLRAIEEKTLVRVGGMRTLVSDFRLIAATNRDLATEVAAGHFREDLYYRLNVIPIILPPLRERIDDIPLLAQHFLNRYSLKYKRTLMGLSIDDEERLKNYHWPGNVRELKNVMERATLLSTGPQFELILPERGSEASPSIIGDTPTMEELQRRYINLIIEKSNGKISGPGGAAQILGMKRTSLYTRMKKLGLR
jgi:transcriptional regulator with GAF, ATPase, and Fis domain